MLKKIIILMLLHEAWIRWAEEAREGEWQGDTFVIFTTKAGILTEAGSP